MRAQGLEWSFAKYIRDNVIENICVIQLNKYELYFCATIGFFLPYVRAILNCLNDLNHNQITIFFTKADSHSLVNNRLSVLSHNAWIGSVMD